jgi:hypothetical protein
MTNLISDRAEDTQIRQSESHSRFDPQAQGPGGPNCWDPNLAQRVSEPALITAPAVCSGEQNCFYCACPETD